MIKFVPVFLVTIFVSLNYGAILYVNSSLLAGLFTQNIVSVLYLIGATASVLVSAFIAKFIEFSGKRALLVIFILAASLGTIGLSFAQSTVLTAISFLLYTGVFFSIYYCLDIFLEELSKNTNTGEVRGIYVTMLNLGIIGGPIILTLLGQKETFQPLYLVATFLMVPALVIAIFFLKSREPKWHGMRHRHIFLPFKAWWKNKNLRGITLARFVLEFFFAFMVIYTPIYLNGTLGFSWQELGIIFTVMLLPFVIFQWPAGELADRFFGEKEILILGFLLMGGSLLFMPFIGKVFMAWLIVLLISRVGASFIEIMTESYFFKHVNAEETGLISIFRLTRPLSMFLGAALGILALTFVSFENIFLVLAVIVFIGLKESLGIRDTK